MAKPQTVRRCAGGMGIIVLALWCWQPSGQSAESSPSDKPPVAAKAPAAEQPATPPAERAPCGCVQAAPACACQVYYCCGRGHRARAKRCYVCVAPVCCQGQAAAGAAPAKADPFAWKDLLDGKTLKGWKPTEFGGEGKVEVKDGMVVMEIGNDMTGITYTGELPRDNFELSLEGMRFSGGDFFCTTTFPVAKEPCTLVVGGWGGTVVGLSNVDGFDAANNATMAMKDFKDNQWYRVRIRVSQPKIEAWIDGERVIEQERKDHKFGIRWECEKSQPLGICTWCTKGAVRNVRLRQLTPDEAKGE
jgi:hypothetical protein